MGRFWLIVICCVVAVGLALGLGLAFGLGHAAGFELTDWSVANDEGYACLHIEFTAKYDGWLSLKNPDGTMTDHEQFSSGDTSAILHMTDNHEEVPKKGQYTLVVKDTSGVTKATKTLYLEGAKVGINGYGASCSCVDSSCTLTIMDIIITNKGDVPLYVSKCTVIVQPGSKSQDVHPHEVVLSGRTKDISIGADFTGLGPGDKTWTVKLYDGAGNLLSSYSFDYLCVSSPSVGYPALA